MKKFVLHLILFLITKSVIAGVSTSGGGYAVVCRDTSKAIVSAELLDLAEGRLKYNFKMKSVSGSTLKDYALGVENVYFLQTGKPWFSCGLDVCEPSEMLSRFIKIIDWVDSSQQLDPIYDLGDVSTVLKQLNIGCDIEQVAIFNDATGRVQISKEAWNKMDSLSQAGLVWHELWYRESRKYYLLPEKNSEKSRLNTAIVFAEGLTPVKAGVPENAKYKYIVHDPNRKVNDMTSFFIFQISESPDFSKNVFRRQFENLGGRTVLTKTYVDMPQGVDYYQKFMLESSQFIGWYLQAEPDFFQETLTGLIVRLYNEKNEVVTSIR